MLLVLRPFTYSIVSPTQSTIINCLKLRCMFCSQKTFSTFTLGLPRSQSQFSNLVQKQTFNFMVRYNVVSTVQNLLISYSYRQINGKAYSDMYFTTTSGPMSQFFQFSGTFNVLYFIYITSFHIYFSITYRYNSCFCYQHLLSPSWRCSDLLQQIINFHYNLIRILRARLISNKQQR